MAQEGEDHIEKEVKLENRLNHKVFLIILKFIPHIIALFYALYNILGFIEIDAVILGHLIHTSLFSWIFLYLTSIIFRYCYVHRLPLYYIAINELITCLDYYVGIPISDFKLLIIHILVIGCLIFGYSYYYIKFKLNNERL